MSSILGLVFDFDIRYFLSTFHNDYVWARNRSCIFWNVRLSITTHGVLFIVC